MSVYIENEIGTEFDFDYEEVIKSVTDYALEYINCPYEAEINVTLTDNENIRVINNEYRQFDKATDVLSFPMIEYNEPGDFSVVEEQAEEYFDPDSGELVLGDIVISVDKVKSQAEEYGHSQKRELAFLVAHSMLHLFGFDHMVDEERTDMENRQREILDKLNITR